MKKKVLSILLVLVMACCTACGLGEAGGDKENTRTEKEDKSNKDKDSDDEESKEQDSDDIADGEEQAKDDVEFEAEPEAAAEVGDIITFGNDTYSNEWIVLDKDENNILIINKYIVQQIKYNETHTGCTWETCTLREWLNNDYYNTAFSDEERARIQLTNVINEDVWGRDCGEDTSDYIYILTYDEAKTYFSNEFDRKATWADGTEGKWWLRTTGKIDFFATMVNMNGALNSDGQSVDNDNMTNVRPVMWISIQ